ncbi:MAG: hypothetical protein U1E27_13280 [Kiritimatiellia bacterium]|nr:hypothetical protein [Kiritimatiellia bacterium]
MSHVATLGFGIAASLVLAVGRLAALEPVDLIEERETLISCALPPESAWRETITRLEEPEPAAGPFSYRLWLPKGYHAEPEKRWPCLFIDNAGGNAQMGTMRNWIQENGFVTVMLIEAKNSVWPTSLGNFLAAHDDVVQRVRILEGMKWATGFSGGARRSSVYVQLRPGFSALLLQGAGTSQVMEGPRRAQYRVEGILEMPWMPVAMTMGKEDSNRSEIPRVESRFSKGQFRCFEFEGKHTWAPQATFEEAANWAMLRIMKEGPINPLLIPIHLAALNDQATAARNLPDPWDRYQALEACRAFAEERALTQREEARALVAELIRDRAGLAAEPAVRKHLVAAWAERIQSILSEPDPWQRYKSIQTVMQEIQSLGGGPSADTHAIRQSVTLEMNRVRTHPAVTRQLAAAANLSRIESNRSRTRPEALRQQVNALLKQYEGTEAALHARELLDKPDEK